MSIPCHVKDITRLGRNATITFVLISIAIQELALLQWRENKVGIALLVAFVVAAVVLAVLS